MCKITISKHLRSLLALINPPQYSFTTFSLMQLRHTGDWKQQLRRFLFFSLAFVSERSPERHSDFSSWHQHDTSRWSQATRHTKRDLVREKTSAVPLLAKIQRNCDFRTEPSSIDTPTQPHSVPTSPHECEDIACPCFYLSLFMCC